MYRGTYRIVCTVSCIVSYRGLGVSFQPYMAIDNANVYTKANFFAMQQLNQVVFTIYPKKYNYLFENTMMRWDKILWLCLWWMASLNIKSVWLVQVSSRFKLLWICCINALVVWSHEDPIPQGHCRNDSGIILCMPPANERWPYSVPPLSLAGRIHRMIPEWPLSFDNNGNHISVG